MKNENEEIVEEEGKGRASGPIFLVAGIVVLLLAVAIFFAVRHHATATLKPTATPTLAAIAPKPTPATPTATVKAPVVATAKPTAALTTTKTSPTKAPKAAASAPTAAPTLAPKAAAKATEMPTPALTKATPKPTATITCPTEREFAELTGVVADRLEEELCAFHWRGDPLTITPPNACPEGWACELGVAGEGNILYYGGSPTMPIYAGTWRLAALYPAEDPVRDPCSFLAKSQEHGRNADPPWTISAGNFSCEQ